MKEFNGLRKVIAAVGPYAMMALAILVSVELAAAYQTGGLDLHAPVSVANNAVAAVHTQVVHHLDKIDQAICDMLIQLQYNCMRGYLVY